MEGKPEAQKRKLTMQYKMEGSIFVPFAYNIKDIILTKTPYQSPCTSCSTLVKMAGRSQSPNVPFGKSFFVNDIWEVQPLDDPAGCVLMYPNRFFIY